MIKKMISWLVIICLFFKEIVFVSLCLAQEDRYIVRLQKGTLRSKHRIIDTDGRSKDEILDSGVKSLNVGSLTIQINKKNDGIIVESNNEHLTDFPLNIQLIAPNINVKDVFIPNGTLQILNYGDKDSVTISGKVDVKKMTIESAFVDFDSCSSLLSDFFEVFGSSVKIKGIIQATQGGTIYPKVGTKKIEFAGTIPSNTTLGLCLYPVAFLESSLKGPFLTYSLDSDIHLKILEEKAKGIIENKKGKDLLKYLALNGTVEGNHIFSSKEKFEKAIKAPALLMIAKNHQLESHIIFPYGWTQKEHRTETGISVITGKDQNYKNTQCFSHGKIDVLAKGHVEIEGTVFHAKKGIEIKSDTLRIGFNQKKQTSLLNTQDSINIKSKACFDLEGGILNAGKKIKIESGQTSVNDTPIYKTIHTYEKRGRESISTLITVVDRIIQNNLNAEAIEFKGKKTEINGGRIHATDSVIFDAENTLLQAQTFTNTYHQERTIKRSFGRKKEKTVSQSEAVFNKTTIIAPTIILEGEKNEFKGVHIKGNTIYDQGLYPLQVKSQIGQETYDISYRKKTLLSKCGFGVTGGKEIESRSHLDVLQINRENPGSMEFENVDLSKIDIIGAYHQTERALKEWEKKWSYSRTVIPKPLIAVLKGAMALATSALIPGGSFFINALNTILSSSVSQAGGTLLTTGNFDDIGNVFKGKEYWKGLGANILGSQFLGAFENLTGVSDPKLMLSASFKDFLSHELLKQGVQIPINTLIAGESFKECIQDGLKNILAGPLSKQLISKVGCLYGSKDIDYLEHKLLHGVIGFTKGFIDNKEIHSVFAASFGAMVSEIAVEELMPSKEELDKEKIALIEEQMNLGEQNPEVIFQVMKSTMLSRYDKKMELAKLIGASSGALFGEEGFEAAKKAANDSIDHNFAHALYAPAMTLAGKALMSGIPVIPGGIVLVVGGVVLFYAIDHGIPVLQNTSKKEGKKSKKDTGKGKKSQKKSKKDKEHPNNPTPKNAGIPYAQKKKPKEKPDNYGRDHKNDQWHKNKDDKWHNENASERKDIMPNRPNFKDETLNDLGKNLYRESDHFPGGSAEKLRIEFMMGQALKHLEKCKGRLEQLTRILVDRGKELSKADLKTAEKLQKTLRDAINFVK
jgi:hypothetical protein